MKKTQNNRKNYRRLKSRHSRLGLGFNHYQVLWRRMERIQEMVRPKSTITYFSDKAMSLTNRYHKQLWSVDPSVFYQSPFVPKPSAEQPAA